MKNRIATASLADYAAVINDEHRAAYGCAQQAIEHARIAGEHLLKAKAALKHGEWLPWLAANVDVSESQAQRYMKVAQNWTAISRAGGMSELTLRGALDSLSKSTPKQDSTKSRTVRDLPTEPEGESKSRTATDLPAAPEHEPQKPAKPAKPVEVEKMQAELEEANSTIKELAAQQQPLQDEVEFLRSKVEDAGDPLKEACAEVKRLQAVVRGQEERIRGLMNEKNEAVRAAKMWKAKFEKAARAAA